MKKFLLAVTFFLPTFCMAQQSDLSVRDALKLMPDSLVPYLSLNNRLDMVDFMDAKMRAAVDNSLGGESEMTFLSDELLLPCLRVLDFCSQACRLTLMIEIDAIDSIPVIFQSNKAANAAPETHTFQWEYIDVLTIYFTIVV